MFWAWANPAQALTCECKCHILQSFLIDDGANDGCVTGHTMCQTQCSSHGDTISYAAPVCPDCTFSQCQFDTFLGQWGCMSFNCGGTLNCLATEICESDVSGNFFCATPNCGGTLYCNPVTEFCDSDAAGNIFCSPTGGGGGGGISCGTYTCNPATETCTVDPYMNPICVPTATGNCGTLNCTAAEVCSVDGNYNPICITAGTGNCGTLTCTSSQTCTVDPLGQPACVAITSCFDNCMSKGNDASTCNVTCKTSGQTGPGTGPPASNPGTGPAVPMGNATMPNFFGYTTISELITALADFIINFIAIPLAVIMIIYAGFLFVTAGGNEEKIRRARRNLLWTVIGVAIILSAKVLITYIQSLLGGTAGTGAQAILNSLKAPLNQAIVVVFALATVYFVWGVVMFVRATGSGDEQGITTGKRHLIWGIIGMCIMGACFGIVNLIQGIFK